MAENTELDFFILQAAAMRKIARGIFDHGERRALMAFIAKAERVAAAAKVHKPAVG